MIIVINTLIWSATSPIYKGSAHGLAKTEATLVTTTRLLKYCTQNKSHLDGHETPSYSGFYKDNLMDDWDNIHNKYCTCSTENLGFCCGICFFHQRKLSSCQPDSLGPECNFLSLCGGIAAPAHFHPAHCSRPGAQGPSCVLRGRSLEGCRGLVSKASNFLIGAGRICAAP